MSNANIETMNPGPGVAKIPLANFKQGIYFLYFKKEIIYIGKASVVAARVAEHYKDREKMFDECRFITFKNIDGHLLYKIEKDYIKRFKPKYNKFHNENWNFVTGRPRSDE